MIRRLLLAAALAAAASLLADAARPLWPGPEEGVFLHWAGPQGGRFAVVRAASGELRGAEPAGPPAAFRPGGAVRLVPLGGVRRAAYPLD